MSETNPRFQPPAGQSRGGSAPVDLVRQVIGEIDELSGITGSSPRSVVAHEQRPDELDLIHKVIGEIDDLADRLAATGGAGAEDADELDFARGVLGEPWRAGRGAPEAEGEEKRLIAGAAPEDEPIPNVAQMRGSLDMPPATPPKPEVVEFSAVAWPEQAELESPASAPVVESAGPDAAPAIETPKIDEATVAPPDAVAVEPAEPPAAPEPELIPFENDEPLRSRRRSCNPQTTRRRSFNRPNHRAHWRRRPPASRRPSPSRRQARARPVSRRLTTRRQA